MRNRLLACVGFVLLALLTMCGGQESSMSGNDGDAPDAAADGRAMVDGCVDGASFCAYECAEGGFWCDPHERCVMLGTQGCAPMACCRVGSSGDYDYDCHN